MARYARVASASSSPAASSRDRTADVERVVAGTREVGTGRAGTGELRRAVESASKSGGRGTAGALPVHPLLAPLLPWSDGLRRGSTVGVVGATSLMLAMLGGAMRAGGYAAVVGVPSLGVLSAAEHGAVLERLALIPAPGVQWQAVVGALLDGVELVVLAVPGEVPAGVAQNLAARARRAGAVLMPLTGAWPGCDVVLTATAHRWTGLGEGRGRLRSHEITVTASGRGSAARPRQITVPLPLPDVDHPPAQTRRPMSDAAAQVSA